MRDLVTAATHALWFYTPELGWRRYWPECGEQSELEVVRGHFRTLGYPTAVERLATSSSEAA
jgi:hypothetical protein